MKNQWDAKLLSTLRESPLFQQEIEKARRELKKESFASEAAKNKYLEKMAKDILIKNHIPSSWLSSIKRYITEGVLEMPEWSAVQLHFHQDKQTGESRLLIEVYPKTSLSDLKSIWHHVKNWQRKMPRIAARSISEHDLKLLDKGDRTYFEQIMEKDLPFTEDTARKKTKELQKVLGRTSVKKK